MGALTSRRYGCTHLKGRGYDNRVFFAGKLIDTPDDATFLPSLEFNDYVNIPYRGHFVKKIYAIRGDFF